MVPMATRCSMNKFSLLDIALTNMNNILACGCLDKSISDHYPTYIIKKRVKIIKKYEIKTCRIFKNYSPEIFSKNLMDLDWSIFDLLTDVDDMWNMILQAILFEIDRMCPVSQMKFNCSRPEWFTSDLYELAKDRDRLFRKFRQSKKKNEQLYQRAVLKRREFAKLVKLTKDSYFKEQLRINQSNASKYWNTISEVLGHSTTKKIDQVFLYGTSHLCSENDTADTINEFFATVGERISEELGSLSYKQLDRSIDFEFSNFPLMSVDTFIDLVADLKTSKPCGIEDLNSKIIIDAMCALPELFTKLCNSSLINGKFPTACKLARISIIPKKGDPRCMDNLRPISILSILGKIIEKFVKNTIVQYLEENDIFYHLQFGFSSGKSTIDAVFYLADKILKNKNDGLYTCVAFLDLTKAFNCVHHGILIDKLSHYGFKGIVLKWFTSYLNERTQFTRLNDNSSSINAVCSGVPQGSVLGPILYSIYINDIGENNISSDILMFADDSLLIQTNTELITCCNNLDLDLDVISNYFKSLKLGLNPKKTKIMHFDKGYKKGMISNSPQISYNGIVIEPVNSFKYLGVWIDNRLKFNIHLDACIRNASHKIYMLRRIRNSLDQKTAILRLWFCPY